LHPAHPIQLQFKPTPYNGHGDRLNIVEAKKLKRTRQIALLAIFLGGSAAYTYSFHTLDAHFLWKSLGVLLPVQIGVSLYLVYLYWSGRLAGTMPQLKKQEKRMNKSDLDS